MVQKSEGPTPTTGVQPVNLKVELQHTLPGRAAETCCNYRITGQSGGIMLVLPPITHIQDMPRD